MISFIQMKISQDQNKERLVNLTQILSLAINKA